MKNRLPSRAPWLRQRRVALVPTRPQLVGRGSFWHATSTPPPPSLPRCWGPFPMTLASSPARWSHAGAVGAAHITDPLRGWREPARITGMLCETHRRRQPGWIGRDGASRRRHERIANTSALEERLPLALCPSPRHNPWLRHRPRPELLPRLTGVGSASTNGHRLSSAPLARGQREGER